MARTNSKSLIIGVTDFSLWESKALQKFKDKGHWVEFLDLDTGPTYDVIIGPMCWRIDPKLKLGDDSTEEESLERQLEMMEKGVRAIKYPKEKKDVKSE